MGGGARPGGVHGTVAEYGAWGRRTYTERRQAQLNPPAVAVARSWSMENDMGQRRCSNLGIQV